MLLTQLRYYFWRICFNRWKWIVSLLFYNKHFRSPISIVYQKRISSFAKKEPKKKYTIEYTEDYKNKIKMESIFDIYK